jgi:hypothetical protein
LAMSKEQMDILELVDALGWYLVIEESRRSDGWEGTARSIDGNRHWAVVTIPAWRVWHNPWGFWI